MRIAFSFDDNHILNLNVADLLEQYGFRATFFINIIPLKKHIGMESKDVRLLHERGHEIAGHTITHTTLKSQNSDQRKYEINFGKKVLEELLKTEVTGFSYPKGQFTEEIKEETRAAGYLYARATGEGNINPDTDKFAIIPTIQINNSLHRRMLRARRNILEGTNFSWTGDWEKSCKKYIEANRGLVHIFGHAWEIEKQGLWTELEDLLNWIKTNRYEVVNGLRDALK